MNPAQLLAHFDRLAEAPDAIPRLRLFILDLAVRGKLVEQDPRDEPASELLNRIQAEKARLVKGGTIRKEKPLPLVSEDELPFGIPKNWHWSQLAEVGFINPRNTAEDELATAFVPMPLISANFGVANKHEVRQWGEIKSGYTHFAEGDVGLAKITPCFENRKSTVFCELTGSIGAGTTELHIIRPILADADFLLIFLKCPHFIETGIPKMTGTAGQKRVPTEYFAYSPFPLPPLAEQHRIVAKVEELMALCDRFEASQSEQESRRNRLVAASLQRLNNGADPDAFRNDACFYFNQLPRLTTRSEHIQQLRQTILNLAVRGKLVHQDPNDEPASELLKHIQVEKMRLVKAGILTQQKLTSSESLELACDSPMNWQAVNFIDVCNLVTSGSRGWAEFYSDTGPKFIRAQNIRFGRLRLEDLACVSLPTKAEGTRTQVSKGDLLIVITGAGVTNPALLDHELGEAYVSQHVALIKPTTRSLSRWLLLCLMAPAGARAELVQRAYGAGKPGLNLDNIRSLRITLPPLAEQHRIIAKVEELMTLCDRLETQLTTTQTESRRLLDAILHLALRQVPNTDVSRATHSSQKLAGAHTSTATTGRPNKHFARTLLSAEIVHQLHAEPTFGRTKHQKILHLCEHIAQIKEVSGEYYRQVAGPLDNRLIYSVEAELKKQRWYEEYRRPQFGHGYRPLEKAGGHLKYLERYWPDKLSVIRRLVDIMRTWDTDRCEMLATVYAAWNDLLIWNREPSDEAILEEVLGRWHESKKRFSEARWQAMVAWIRKEGIIPVGFGRPTKQLANP